jgi:hypothetical protein
MASSSTAPDQLRVTDSAGAIPDLGPESYAQWRASELGAITARVMSPDPVLGRLTTVGAGFVALSAAKPTGAL